MDYGLGAGDYNSKLFECGSGKKRNKFFKGITRGFAGKAWNGITDFDIFCRIYNYHVNNTSLYI